MLHCAFVGGAPLPNLICEHGDKDIGRRILSAARSLYSLFICDVSDPNGAIALWQKKRTILLRVTRLLRSKTAAAAAIVTRDEIVTFEDGGRCCWTDE